MKIRELDFFDEDIRQEFCAYLKKYINTKDFKEICALYDSLDFKYKKDDVKEFYNAIASVLSKDYEPYILDNKKIFTCFNKAYSKQDICSDIECFTFSNKGYSEQGIYSDNECLTFTVYVHNDEKNVKAAFGVGYEQTNILTLAEGLVNIQKKLEELIK